MAREKISVAVGMDELAWAREKAEREGSSLSAVVSDSLRRHARQEARARVGAWLGEGREPVTDEEIAQVVREWVE